MNDMVRYFVGSFDSHIAINGHLDRTKSTHEFEQNVNHLFEENNEETGPLESNLKETLPPKKTLYGFHMDQIKWSHLIFLTWLHLFTLYGFIHALISPVGVYTLIFLTVLSMFCGIGQTVGAHRLWSHKSFKAHLLVKIFLLILQTATVSGSALSYARDHRCHHKWTDTEKDPKNPKRGMFYAHFGWWLLKKNQIVLDQGRKLNFDDLYNDPLLSFQHKYYAPLAVLLGFVIPSLVPWYFWNENLWTAFLMCGVCRVCVLIHHISTVNSLAHYVGIKPYDRFILPVESDLVVYLSLGEGSHNYHHIFPRDFKTSEKDFWELYSPSTLFIRCCQVLGLAYDLKYPSKESIHKVVESKGLPEYFEPTRNRRLITKALIGGFDWIIGFVVSMWSIFSIILFKLATGQDLFLIYS